MQLFHLVWHSISFQGDDWEAIKSAWLGNGGLKVETSQSGITKLASNSIPNHLKMLPIVYSNIGEKDAEISEVTGTMYTTTATASNAGMFVLPATPIGRANPVQLRAKEKGSGRSLLINGEENYSVDLNSADVILIIHNEGDYNRLHTQWPTFWKWQNEKYSKDFYSKNYCSVIILKTTIALTRHPLLDEFVHGYYIWSHWMIFLNGWWNN